MKKFFKTPGKTGTTPTRLIRLLLLLLMAWGSVATYAQVIGIVEGLTLITPRSGQPDPHTGNIGSELPCYTTTSGSPLYINRFYKFNSNGDLEELTAVSIDTAFHNYYPYCTCPVSSLPPIYRVVTIGCRTGSTGPWKPDPYSDPALAVSTNSCTASELWSDPLTWYDYKVPNPATGTFYLNRNVTLDVNYDATNKGINCGYTSSLTINGGVTLTTVNSSAGRFINNGVLNGAGQYAGVINNGVVSPGGSGIAQYQGGKFTQNASGTLDMQLASTTSFDKLYFTSDVSVLGGTLKVSLLNGFVPVQNNSFNIIEMSYGTYTGKFSNVDMPPLPNGLKWQVSYNPTDVRITIVDSGKLGGAFKFSGGNYSTIPTNNFPVANSNYTIECWVKAPEDRFNNIIIWGNNSLNTLNGLALLTGNKIDNYWGGGLNTELIITAPTVNDGNWHHLAATYDGTTRKIYMDGIVLGSDNPTGHNVTSGTTGYLGGFNTQLPFVGTLDEVRVFSRALTQAEIMATKNCEIPSSTSGLSAYYKFNQGLAYQNNNIITNFADASPNGNSSNGWYGYQLVGADNNFVEGAITNGHSCAPCVPVTSTFSKTDAICYRSLTGTITITPTNGVWPYKYKLSTSGSGFVSDSIFTGLKRGTYRVTIMDAFGCTGITSSIAVGGPTVAVTGTATTTSATCYHTFTGSITVTPTTGVAPYTYRLGTTGSYGSSNTFTNLYPKAYYVYIKDANGCEGYISVTVGQPAAITGTFTKTDVTGCYGGTNGSLSVTPITGFAPYQYKLNATGTYGSSNSFSGLKASTYRVYIKDANGCEGYVSVPITQPIRVSATISITPVSCPGATDGAINAFGTSGIAPYTYRLGTTGAYGPSGSFTNLSGKNYALYVLDANNCGYAKTVTVLAAATTCFEKMGLAKAGIATANSNNDLRVSLSPNPSSNVFKLTTQTAKAEAIQLRVIDINGKVVYTAKGSPTQTFTFGEALTNGVYLIEVRQGNEVKAMKVIKN